MSVSLIGSGGGGGEGGAKNTSSSSCDTAGGGGKWRLDSEIRRDRRGLVGETGRLGGGGGAGWDDLGGG